MKNDYPELNFDMEHLLQTKKYEELTPEELNEISDFISCKDDYVLMQNTFLSVKSSFGAEEEIIPAEDTKSKLMKAFDDKHGKVVSINKPRPFYLNPLFQVGVAAVFILGIVFFYPSGENNDNITAMNHADENKKESESPKEEMVTESSDEEAVDGLSADKDSEVKMDEASDLEEASEEKSFEELDSKPSGFADKTIRNDNVTMGGITSTVTTKNSPSNDLNSVDNNRSELAEVMLEKEVLDDSKAEDAAVSQFFSSPATTISTNDLSVAKTESKKSSKNDRKDKAKEKSEGDVRTNSIGGRYYQPATPVDVKVGVSLSEKPDLATFLFTAL